MKCYWNVFFLFTQLASPTWERVNRNKGNVPFNNKNAKNYDCDT